MQPDAHLPRLPRQDRSRRTLARLLAAARKLLVEKGVDAVTVHAVVDRAEASVGSFYARFAGKDELLAYVQEHVWGDVSGWWEGILEFEEWEDLTLEDTVRRAVLVLAESLWVFQPERRALRARSEGVVAEEAFDRRMREALTHRLLAAREEIRHPHPEHAVDLGLRAVLGALRDLDRDADAPLGDPREELSRLLVSYLRGSPGQGASEKPPGKVDFFDVWG